MTSYLYQDTETFSPVPIKNGVHAYAEEVEVMLYAYAFDDEPVEVVDLTKGEVIPERVLTALKDDVTSVFHNSHFDRTVMRHDLGIDIRAENIHDTMVQALAHGLPGGLGILCEIMGVPTDQAKDKEGKKLINRFCKPLPKNQKLRRATSKTHPEEWTKFVDYAKNDIEAMRVISKKIPMWNYKANGEAQGCERTLWELDQKINDRGFKVDVDLAHAAIRAVEIKQIELAEQTIEATSGEVERATQRDKMLQHILKAYNVFLPDLQKSTLERRVNDTNLPEAVRELLALRLEASTTSTSKYKKLIDCVSSDERLRATLQFDGAMRTRRWAGRLFQPQNLPRPQYKNARIETAIEALKLDGLDLIEDDIMGMTSSCIRGCIVASEGKKLSVSDLSNIEGRFAAWVADEEWKNQAFRDFDNGKGHDLYKVAYARAFNVTPESVNDSQRQIGKVMELMLQYAGGVGAFLTGAASYGIDLEALADTALQNIPEVFKQEAKGFYDWSIKQNRSTYGLSQRAFITCDALKRMWRHAHPQISSIWKDLEIAATKAINNKGELYECRKLRVVCKGPWLRIILPSGHSLCYPSPRVENGNISYMGTNPYTRKWERIKTYGGKFFENICQSGSRDVMAYNMPLAEAQGYAIILTVHDELITETPDNDNFSHENLSEILATNPHWCPDLPLAAGGFEGYRYRKD